MAGRLGVALALVALMVVALRAPATTQQATPGLYIALGDSIAAGIGASLPAERGYPALVQAFLAHHAGATVPYENLAVPGETAETFLTAGQAERFTASVERARANGLPIAAVTVTLGGNELLNLRDSGVTDRQAGLDAFTSAYDAALALVRQTVGPEVPVVVTTYYDLTDGDPALQGTDAWWIERFNGVIRDTASRHGAAVADVAPAFAGRIVELTLAPVDVHPSNAGHAAIARLVWQALAFDTTPPAIDAPTTLEASRETPTLAFAASDASGTVEVGLEAEQAAFSAPLLVGENRYVSLIDLAGLSGDTYRVDIVATDAAGNVARHRVDIVRVESQDSEDTP